MMEALSTKVPAGKTTALERQNKYGQAARALLIRREPGTRQCSTTASNAACSSSSAAARHTLQAAANLARQRTSRSSATSMSSSAGSEVSVRGSSEIASAMDEVCLQQDAFVSVEHKQPSKEFTCMIHL